MAPLMERVLRKVEQGVPDEAVTQGENARRGMAPTVVTWRTDRCQRGHDFTANAYVWPKTGARQCGACRRERRAGAA